MALCTHLGDYGAQFTATDAAYRACVKIVDAIVAEGPGDGRAEQVAKAIDEWRQQDARLRSLLVELVKDGRVRVPRRMAAPGPHRRTSATHGTVVCAACRRAVPRLKYPEWQFAYNGVVSFRGNEVRAGQPVGS